MSNDRIKRITDLNITKKRLFMRLDFNVPLSAPVQEGERSVRRVESSNRIQQALPTIRYAIENGAKVIVASHLGRPKGKKSDDLSLAPVAHHLAQLLDQDVHLMDDCVGEGLEVFSKQMNPGQVMMLENLRFHGAEEANDPQFCERLSRLCDVYITDAFGTAHRKHASTFGLPQLMEQKGIGFLIEKELSSLNKLLNHPERPFHLVLGGAKVHDKIKTIESLLSNVDSMCVGGLMAYAFMDASDIALPMGAKHPMQEDIDAARRILRSAEKRNVKIILPIDFNNAFDIGPQTVELFGRSLQDAKTLFWNGPLGWFEEDEYAKGTLGVAQLMAQVKAFKVVGGGDTIAAVRKANSESSFDHLSTGGGAVLKYLEDGSLPGIDILKSSDLPSLSSRKDPLRGDEDETGRKKIRTSGPSSPHRGMQFN